MTQPARDDIDTEKLLSGIRRQLRALESHAASEGPWVLAEIIQIQSDLRAIEYRTVAALRDRKYHWASIGYALGQSKQTVHKRYIQHVRRKG